MSNVTAVLDENQAEAAAGHSSCDEVVNTSSKAKMPELNSQRLHMPAVCSCLNHKNWVVMVYVTTSLLL